MSKKISEQEPKPSRKRRKATSPEARENQMIALAIDAAEKQLLEGTASSQVITHFLKLGSMKAKKENKILDKQAEMLEAKTESLKSTKKYEELVAEAIKAMRTYSGKSSYDE